MITQLHGQNIQPLTQSVVVDIPNNLINVAMFSRLSISNIFFFERCDTKKPTFFGRLIRAYFLGIFCTTHLMCQVEVIVIKFYLINL